MAEKETRFTGTCIIGLARFSKKKGSSVPNPLDLPLIYMQKFAILLKELHEHFVCVEKLGKAK